MYSTVKKKSKKNKRWRSISRVSRITHHENCKTCHLLRPRSILNLAITVVMMGKKKRKHLSLTLLWIRGVATCIYTRLKQQANTTSHRDAIAITPSCLVDCDCNWITHYDDITLCFTTNCVYDIGCRSLPLSPPIVIASEVDSLLDTATWLLRHSPAPTWSFHLRDLPCRMSPPPKMTWEREGQYPESKEPYTTLTTTGNSFWDRWALGYKICMVIYRCAWLIVC